MSHQPYEDLLFSDEELAVQESTALREHLQECESCYQLSIAWGAVEIKLQESPLAAPEPHFVNRWRTRLEAERIKNQKRQNRIMLILTWGIAAIILAALVYLALPLFQSPKVVALTYLYQLINLVWVVNFVQGLFNVITNSVFGVFSFVWLGIAVGVMTLLSVLWVVSIRYLTSPRRVTL